MDSVKELFAQDFSATIISLLIIMSGIITMGKIISDFAKIVAKPVSKIKQQQDDHKLLADAIQNLEELHKIHDEDMKATNGQDELIRQDLHALTITVNEIIERLDIMQSKIVSTEMIKLKEKILGWCLGKIQFLTNRLTNRQMLALLAVVVGLLAGLGTCFFEMLLQQMKKNGLCLLWCLKLLFVMILKWL